MKKIFSLILPFLLCAFPAIALKIPEGAIVKTADNPDVYVIKYMNGKSYKRLILNPQVFESYGHLKWENLLTIDQATMDSFLTSDLVRVEGQSAVYRLVPDGDTGSRILLSDLTDLDPDSIYTINALDFKNYTDMQTAALSGPYAVLKVIDGDTLSVTIDDTNQTIRLIGVDSPEVTSSFTDSECYGPEASAKAKELLTGKSILLESDAASGDQDIYGRLLRYVFLSDGTLFNEWLISEGYAKEYTYNGITYKYQSLFRAAETAAKSAQKGLWNNKVCSEAKDFFGDEGEYVCSSNAYNCSDFDTQAESQAAYAYCLNRGKGDIHELDSDDYGTACESLR
jgi:micrococcal nuclease